MSRTAPQITSGPEDEQTLKRWAASRTEAKQTVERARIILGCLDGKRVQQIALECGTRPNTNACKLNCLGWEDFLLGGSILIAGSR
jgi:hypothetical protein